MIGKMRGEFHWQLLNSDGTVEIEGKQPNLILDSGLNAFANTSDLAMTGFRQYLCIGTNGNAPAVNQTTLGAEVQVRTASNGGFTGDETQVFAADLGNNVWRSTSTIVKVLTLTANANIAEFGLSANFGLNSIISIRELPRNNLQQPIVISALSTQQFKVTHTLIVELPNAPVAQNVNIAGYGIVAGTESWFYDPAAVAGGTNIGLVFSAWIPGLGLTAKPINNTSSISQNVNPTTPWANNLNAGATPQTYVNNSFQRIKRISMSPSQFVGNHGGWRASIDAFSTPAGAGYKFVLDNTNYPKTADDKLDLDLVVSWSRAP